MIKLNRWLCLVLTLTLSAALILPAQAADPLSASFATFLIDAQSADSPELELQVALYRRDGAGSFRVDDSVRYDSNVNRMAGPASFYIQPKTDGVWVEVDYLTDLNGDGVYEMLDGEASRTCDSMTAEGALRPWDGSPRPLTRGQTYILSGETLSSRGAALLQARNTPGSGQALPGAGGKLPDANTILYFVSLHYVSPADQEEYVLCYFLRLFDTVIVPSDVSPSAWYYSAVEYALDRDLFSGTGADAFSPGATVTRAQLAQVLWRMGGSKPAAGAAFSDVQSTAWYAEAVSWCGREKLMSGTGTKFLPDTPLTREQLAVALWQYAQYAGLNSEGSQALSRFTDGGSASVWARASLEWATDCGLLSGYADGSLQPCNGLKRCELAAVLRAFSQHMPQQSR